MDTGRGVSGEGGASMNWEVGTDVYPLPSVQQIASGNLLYNTGSESEFTF